MRALIILGVVALIVIGVVLVAWIENRSRHARRDRRERKRCEALLGDLHKSAIAVLDVDPFAALVAEKIRNHYTTNRKVTR